MDKYSGIKQAVIIQGRESWSRREKRSGSSRVANSPSHFLRSFIVRTIIAAAFVGLFLLLGIFENDGLQNVLDYIRTALTYDLLGTNPISCLINGLLGS